MVPVGTRRPRRARRSPRALRPTACDRGRWATGAGRGAEGASALGPGLLESAYENCLAHELTLRGLEVRRQVALPIEYEGLRLESGYRLDMLVQGAVVVEVKSVEALSRLHEAQLLTYLRLSGLRLGYLMNFNAVQLRHGLKRFVR